MFEGGAFFHAIFAFFIPGAWALILYPYCRLYQKDWQKMLFYALILSFISMVIKELFDSALSVNDIVADLLGLFFGTAIVVTVFRFATKNLSQKASFANQRVSLRGLLFVAKRLEARASAFYDNAAQIISDPKAKELCLKMTKEERHHADIIGVILDRWLPTLPDPSFINWVDKELVQRDIFMHNFSKNSTAKEVLQYAIEQEKKVGEFYALFKTAFPEEWKKKYVQQLVEGESEHERALAKLS